MQYSIVGRSFGSEPVAELGKSRVPYLFHYLGDGLLDDPVQDGGDAQKANTAVRFVNCLAFHGQGSVSAIEQVLSDLGPVPPEVAPYFTDGHHVDAGGALVGTNLV